MRHCPVCDAFEVTGQDIAVFGRGAAAIGEAIFMRTYSRRVTLLLLPGVEALDEEGRRRIAANDIHNHLWDGDQKAAGLTGGPSRIILPECA